MAVVETLGRLSDVSGRADVARLLCGAATESQARFIATSLRMLAEYHRDKKPLTALAVHGPVIGRDRDGALGRSGAGGSCLVDRAGRLVRDQPGLPRHARAHALDHREAVAASPHGAGGERLERAGAADPVIRISWAVR